MKPFLFFSAIILTGLFSFAQESKVINDPNAQRRNVTGFHAIHISGGIDLYLTQGNEETVVVSAAETHYRDRIRTEVVNGVLKIYMENLNFDWRNWGGGRKLKAYVSCKLLDDLRASGGSDVYLQEAIRSDKLGIGLSGGADLKGKLIAGELTVSQSGGSDAFLSGTAASLSIHTSGGSDFHGFELVAEHCRADASGGSDIYVFVNKDLDVSASGGADVHYKGTGSVVNSHTSGGGGVHRKD